MKNNFFLVWFIMVSSTVGAQQLNSDLPIHPDSIYSQILNEPRQLQVILPADYKPGSKKKYDVIYVLDGEWDTKKVSQFQKFAVSEKFIPENIIIGIPNTYSNGQNQRQRDFTPTHVAEPSNSGGAENFIAFFKNELMPYINEKYPTNSAYNTLWGSSSGGLFGMYVFLTRPELFQSYILSDPALWWDNQYLVKLANEKWEAAGSKNKCLYISGRDGEAFRHMGIADMDSVLIKKAPKELHWKCVAYHNETHSSVILKTAYDGLKWTYAGYNPADIEFHPMNGILLKDKPADIYLMEDGLNPSFIAFTTDGTEPVDSSPRVQSKMPIAGPADLTFKSICNRDEYDKKTIGKFPLGKSLKSGRVPKKAIPGGFHYSYYEGKWDSLPRLQRIKPLQSGVIDEKFSINNFSSQNSFVLLVEGYLEMQKEGYCIFVLDGDNSDKDDSSKQYAKLYLGNQLLLDCNYNCVHGKWKIQSYVLPLEKGFYPFRLEFLHKQGVRNLKLSYLPAGNDQPSLIPLSLQYSVR